MSVITPLKGPSPKPPAFDYDDVGTDEEGNLYHFLYGTWWPRANNQTLLDIELQCMKDGVREEEGGLGKYGHFVEAANLLFNWGSKERVEWNPWMEKMLTECCDTFETDDFLAVAGCSSSSKSFAGAVWVWVNWLADPENTLGLVTSTSITAAKKRIWRSMVQLYNALPPAKKAIVKYRPSLNMFQWIPPNGVAPSESSAICLVAAEAKQEATASSKLIGAKNDTVFLIGDELCELSPAILAVAIDNLPSNPKFHMVAMSNPKDREDSFGIICEPVDGWDSINESSYEWDTKFGRAIRFDCLQSPNYLERSVVYRYMLTYERIEKAREIRGENSSHFYRFFRGFFPIQGAEDVLYTDVDFSAWMPEKVEWGNTPPVMVAGLDPSFSSGGDLTILAISLFGRDHTGKFCFEFQDAIPVKEDAQDKKTPRTDQILSQVKIHLDQLGITYNNLAIDNTGAGNPFCDRAIQILSHEFLRVDFGGKASDMTVSAKDQREAHKLYTNKVSEIWSVGREFLRGGQLAGFRKSKDMMAQLKIRRYETVKSGDGERIRVESKKDMKARSGRSPDHADAMLIALWLCRQRYRFRSEERGQQVRTEKSLTTFARSRDVVSLSSKMNDWYPIS